jgi:hypothetical protein
VYESSLSTTNGSRISALIESFPVLVTLFLVESPHLFSCDRLRLLLHHFDQPPLQTQADFRQHWPASGQRTRDLVCS